MQPSQAQLAAFAGRRSDRPVVLFYQWRSAQADATALLDELAALARRFGGQLRWAGAEEQVLIGAVPQYGHCCRLHFARRDHALHFIQSEAHAALLAQQADVQVSVISEQPRMLRVVTWAMAQLLPRWRFDNTVDDTPLQADNDSTMPTAAAEARLLAHPEQNSPVVMVNWLRFRPYTGQAAYHRYGKVAIVTLHSLGAKALFVARYQQVLIGHGGDPATTAWDEFAMVQYPGRAAFKTMTRLARYRRALADRRAGLDDNGQGLVVTRPLAGFVWRR